MTDTDRMVVWLREAMDAATKDAEAASGGTVTGEPGAWVPSPAGDEWEAHRSEHGDEELLVALRPGLPRPPDVMSGMWGAVVSNVPDATDPDAWSPMPQFAHAARHDPAAVLRRIAADRKQLAEHEPVPNHGRFSHSYGKKCPAFCEGECRNEPKVCLTCRDSSGDPIEAPCKSLEHLTEGYGWTEETT